MKDKRPHTIFLDIDGCIFEHPGNPNPHTVYPPKLLDGVTEKLNEWVMNDYKIVLVTGRKECTRKETEDQLRYCGITWDHLIMGLGGGVRVLINDSKPNHKGNTAIAYTIKRNTKDLNKLPSNF